MRLPGTPRISDENWERQQAIDLKAMWDDIVRVVNTNALVVASPQLSKQVAVVPSTNFLITATFGFFRLSYYLETTTADGAAGTIQLSVAFTDDAGATTVASAALSLAALGRTSGIFCFRLAAAPIAFSTILTGAFHTAQYALYMTLEQIG